MEKRFNYLVVLWLVCVHAWGQVPLKPVSSMDHNAEIVSAQFSTDDGLLITASADGIVKLWDPKSGSLIRPLGVVQPLSKVFYAELSPNGELVATVNGRTGRVWSTKFGDQAFPITGHRDTINAVHFSENGKWIVTASTDGSAKVWECLSGKRHHSLNHMLESLSKKGSSGVTEARFCNKGKWLITGSNRKTEGDSLVGGNSGLRSLRYDSTLLVWDLHTGKVIGSTFGYPFNVSEDGMHVIAGSANTKEKCFRVWGAAAANTVHAMESHAGRITNCEFSRDGKWILTTSAEEGNCLLWNATSYKVIHALKIGATNVPNEAHFSPDGKWIATFSGDSSKVWEATSGKLTHTMLASKPIVFSYESKRMVVIIGKRAIQYDVLTGKPIVFPKDLAAKKTVKDR